MDEETRSGRAPVPAGRVTRVLWGTAGAEPASIRSQRDAKRFARIGGAVFSTAGLAFVAAFIAAHEAFGVGVILSVLVAVFWAVVIFNYDAMLVSGRTDSIDDSGAWRPHRLATVGVWIFRLTAAILIGLAISDPLVIQLFHDEVKTQIFIDGREERTSADNANNLNIAKGDKAVTSAIDAQFTQQQDAVDKLYTKYQTAITAFTKADAKASAAALSAQCENAGQVECPGGDSRGTGVPGTNGHEYKIKEQRAINLQNAAAAALADETAAANAYKTANDALTAAKAQALIDAGAAPSTIGKPAPSTTGKPTPSAIGKPTPSNSPSPSANSRPSPSASSPIGTENGYFAKRAALGHYLDAHPSDKIARYVLTAIFVLIDTAGLILKGLFRTADHDKREKDNTTDRLLQDSEDFAEAAVIRQDEREYATKERVETGAARDDELAKQRAKRAVELQAFQVTLDTDLKITEVQTRQKLVIAQAQAAADEEIARARITWEKNRKVADIGSTPGPPGAGATTGTGAGPIGPDPEPTLTEPTPTEQSDDPLDLDDVDAPPADWSIWHGRWKLVAPLLDRRHTQEGAEGNGMNDGRAWGSGPWVAVDLQREYDEELVLKPLSPRGYQDIDDVKGGSRDAANQLSMQQGFIHKHLADILDARYDRDKGAYLVHYLYGDNLDDFLWDNHNSDQLTLRVAAELFYGVVKGVCALWTKMGRLHLDLKCRNVALDDKDGSKVLDFGLSAKLDGSSPSGDTTFSPRGSQFYSAPEQWAELQPGQTRRLSMATDVRGLGAIAYKVFSGRPPGDVESKLRRDGRIMTPTEIDLMLVTEAPRPLQSLVRLPTEFATLIDRWLSVIPDQRVPGGDLDDPDQYVTRLLEEFDHKVRPLIKDARLAQTPLRELRRVPRLDDSPDTARGSDADTETRDAGGEK